MPGRVLSIIIVVIILDSGRSMWKASEACSNNRKKDIVTGSEQEFQQSWRKMGSRPGGYRTCLSCLDNNRYNAVPTQDVGCGPHRFLHSDTLDVFPSLEQELVDLHVAKGHRILWYTGYRICSLCTRAQEWYIISERDSFPIKSPNRQSSGSVRAGEKPACWYT